MTRTKRPLTRGRLIRRVLLAAFLVFVLAVGISVFVSWRLANQAPEWWKPLNPSDPGVDEAARAVENGITRQMHQSRPAATGSTTVASPPEPGRRPSDEWTMSIKSADANAWLAARLKEWLLNRSESLVWPVGASQPQVSFEQDNVAMGFEVSQGSTHRVVSVSLAPHVDEEGKLWLRLNGVAIGRFSLRGSKDLVEAGGSMLQSKLPPEMRDNPDTRTFIDALGGKKPLAEQAVLKLSDGRRVQVMKIAAREGWLDVTCRTLTK